MIGLAWATANVVHGVHMSFAQSAFRLEEVLLGETGKAILEVSLLLGVCGWAVGSEGQQQAGRDETGQSRTLFHASRQPMLLVDPYADYRIVDANQAARGLCRLSSLNRQTLSDLGELSGSGPELMFRVDQAERFFLIQSDSDGQTCTLEVYASPVELDGQSLQLLVLHDATERLRTQQELEKSRQQLLRAETSAGLGHWEWDLSETHAAAPQTTVPVCHPEHAGGLEVETFIGQIIHKDDRQAVREALRMALDYGDALDVEFRSVLSDGTIRFLHVRGEVIRTAAGCPRRIVGTSLDVTDRRRAENLLRRSEGRYRTLVETCPNGILEINPDGQIEYVNTALTRITGYAWEDLVGQDLSLLLADAEERRSTTLHIARVLRGDPRPATWQAVYRRKDGEPMDVQIDWDYHCDAQGAIRGFVLVVTDITDRQRHEKRILEYQKKLKSLAAELSAAEERQRRRLALTLHDGIGQELFGLKANLGLARNLRDAMKCDALLCESQNLVDKIMSDARNLTFELCPPVLYEIGLGAALAWLTQHVENVYGLCVEFQGDECCPLAMSDELRGVLYQAARELLFNVFKHAHASHSILRLCEDEHRVVLEVTDDGCGFDPMSIDDSSSPRGFGLFHVRERLESFGGRMTCESVLGQGSRISLEAPLFPMCVEEC